MKKILIESLSMQKCVEKHLYKSEENSSIQNELEVLFPVNGILSRDLTQDDELYIILIKTNTDCEEININEEKFKEEIYGINRNIGAKIRYITIQNTYDFNNKTYEALFAKLIKELSGFEEGTRLSVDVTFGPRPFMIILFNLLVYAEKFLEFEIDHIIYGKAEFITKDGKSHINNTEVFDLVSLYYLNKIFSKLDCDKDRAQQFLLSLLA